MDNRPQRRSIRLRDYDYRSEGAYFVTICTHDRTCLFGHITENGVMMLNPYGEIVRKEWLRTAEIRSDDVVLDAFVIMPNHFHGILVVVSAAPQRATQRVAPTTSKPCGPDAGSLGAIIGQFKSAVSKRINVMRQTRGAAVWQRNYYEHIIRDEHGLNHIRAYIETNPERWAEDSLHPNHRR